MDAYSPVILWDDGEGTFQSNVISIDDILSNPQQRQFINYTSDGANHIKLILSLKIQTYKWTLNFMLANLLLTNIKFCYYFAETHKFQLSWQNGFQCKSITIVQCCPTKILLSPQSPLSCRQNLYCRHNWEKYAIKAAIPIINQLLEKVSVATFK